MKLSRTLSLFAVINFIGVIFVSNSLSFTNDDEFNTPTPIVPSPTPIVIVKKVINKIVKTAEPVVIGSNTQQLTQATSGNTNVTTNNSQTVTQTQQTQSPQSNRCIVVVDGANYDLTNFINIHSGGNIFSCNSDMSQTFWSQHSQKQLNQLQQYRI